MFNTQMKIKAEVNEPFALRYNLRVHTLEPARLHAIKVPLALDKIVPTHVNRTIVIAKRNSATSSEKEDTDKKER